jgi:transcriptional regulator with XRE-family HTH domain
MYVTLGCMAKLSKIEKDEGSRLRSARERARMSQQEVSDAFGVGRTTYLGWERGRIPDNRRAELQSMFELDEDFFPRGERQPSAEKRPDELTPMELVLRYTRVQSELHMLWVEVSRRMTEDAVKSQVRVESSQSPQASRRTHRDHTETKYQIADLLVTEIGTPNEDDAISRTA